MGKLDGRVALITSAGRGFGKAMALAFAREGADVAVNYNASAGPAAEVVAEIQRLGRKAIALRGDVAREDDVKALVDGALTAFGTIDILMNNAGVMDRGMLAEVPVSTYARMFEINVTGTMLCAHYALPTMIERKYGRIVNLSSQLARANVGRDGFAAYAATKGAVESFTKAMQRYCDSLGMTGTKHRFGIPPKLGRDHTLEQVTTTTPNDQGMLLELIWKGTTDAAVASKLQVTPELCKLAIDILSWQKLKTRLPSQLPLGTKVAHKTGTGSRGFMDAGIIFKDGQPLYILTAYTEHVPEALPDGTPGFTAAYQLIGSMARLAWDGLGK